MVILWTIRLLICLLFAIRQRPQPPFRMHSSVDILSSICNSELLPDLLRRFHTFDEHHDYNANSYGRKHHRNTHAHLQLCRYVLVLLGLS